MFNVNKNVHIGKRSDGSVNLLRHNQQPFTQEMADLAVASPTALAKAYVNKVHADYEFDPEMLSRLSLVQGAARSHAETCGAVVGGGRARIGLRTGADDERGVRFDAGEGVPRQCARGRPSR